MSLPGVDRAGPALRWVVWAAVVAAAAYLVWRGVWRSGSESGDLAVGYSAGRAWLAGLDPYDVGALRAELERAGGAALASGDLLERLRNVYFPTTLPVFAPLALLGWPEARLLILALNVAATVFIAVGIGRLIGWRPTTMKGLALIAFVLALAPFHTTIAFGQTGILATAAVVAAVLAERQQRPYAAGLLYGVAALIKMQIGLPFVLYLLWRRRWILPAVASLVIASSTALSVIRMQVAGAPWASGWSANLGVLSGPGGINDPGVLNEDRFSLLDLAYPLRSLVDNGPLVLVMTLVLLGSLALGFIWARRGRDPSPDLLALGFVSVVGLLVTYHRYYDAVLLAIPIAWACSVLGTVRRTQGLLVLLLCADFVLPLQSIFHEVEVTGVLPSWLTDSAIWTTVVLAQHVWALVLMAIVLLFAAVRERPVPFGGSVLAADRGAAAG